MSTAHPVPTLVHSRPLVSSPDEPLNADQTRRMRGPIVAGTVTCLVFVVGFFVFAAVFKLAGGVPAPGTIVLEDSRKTVQQLDGGTVREIRVHEGDHVSKGQVLMVMDDTQARAQVDVLANQYDSLLAQKARLDAELGNQKAIAFPPELTSRAGEPRVAGLMRDQTVLFKASLGVFESQAGVLAQRVQQLESRGKGNQAQIDSIDEQNKLVADEMQGVSSLYERGFAPKSRLLALQRSQAGLVGERGAREADMATVGQSIGENRIQLAQLQQQRATQSADTMRQVQVQLADLEPKLKASQAVLDRTILRSPADGEVLGLTQFTIGGVIRPGDRLMDIVPTNGALVVKVAINPDHIDEVKVGMPAEVRLSAYSSRTVPPVKAKVVTLSADRITNDKGESFFYAELAVDPKELKKLPEVKLTPGMPAQAIIVTGERTILNYLTKPLVSSLTGALREN